MMTRRKQREHMGSSRADWRPRGRRKGDLVTDQVGAATGKWVSDQPHRFQSLKEKQWKVVVFCDVPRSLADMMDELGLKYRTMPMCRPRPTRS